MNQPLHESLSRHFPDLTDSGWRMLGEGFGSSVYEHCEGNVVVRVARSAVAGKRLPRHRRAGNADDDIAFTMLIHAGAETFTKHSPTGIGEVREMAAERLV